MFKILSIISLIQMETTLRNKKINEVAERVLLKYKLCDSCLGRLFAKKGHGYSNRKRGEIIRKNINKREKTEIHECWLCSGLIDEISHFSDLISSSLTDYEFDTFLVGSKIDEDIQERETEILDFTGSEYAEPIKMELNREIGKILEEKLGKEVDFEKPTIMAVVATVFDVVNLQVSSLFVYGRYKKYRRDIPQTKWFCGVCRGKGCRSCGYTGKLYEWSVEELIAGKFLEKTGGNDESFHGGGREDIDVRMLGNGRPFVLEIKNPRVRNMDLSKLEREINASNKDVVEVSNLRFSDKEEITRIKNAKFRKKYHVFFKGDKILNKEKLKKAAQVLQGKTISQFTPARVAHRRANAVREKQIYSCILESVDDTIASMVLEAESGTYIKELISGDDGRTTPSLSEIIGIPCKVTELDVIEIKGE
jgi:tRNA pseudouridine synthase 10